MPNSKVHRRGQEEKDRRGRLTGKASSFHGRVPVAMAVEPKLLRPKTLPNLVDGIGFGGLAAAAGEGVPRLTKLLLNVTIQGSLGAVQVVMTPESAVEDLVAAALKQYVKEGRRPILPTVDAGGYGLHYSQFSLESLDPKEKLMELGSRNFFLCPRKSDANTSCSKEAVKGSKATHPWLKFMDFLL